MSYDAAQVGRSVGLTVAGSVDGLQHSRRRWQSRARTFGPKFAPQQADTAPAAPPLTLGPDRGDGAAGGRGSSAAATSDGRRPLDGSSRNAGGLARRATAAVERAGTLFDTDSTPG